MVEAGTFRYRRVAIAHPCLCFLRSNLAYTACNPTCVRHASMPLLCDFLRVSAVVRKNQIALLTSYTASCTIALWATSPRSN